MLRCWNPTWTISSSIICGKVNVQNKTNAPPHTPWNNTAIYFANEKVDSIWISKMLFLVLLNLYEHTGFNVSVGLTIADAGCIAFYYCLERNAITHTVRCVPRKPNTPNPNSPRRWRSLHNACIYNTAPPKHYSCTFVYAHQNSFWK